MTIHIHDDDLPTDVDLGVAVAIDTETMGLNPHRDRPIAMRVKTHRFGINGNRNAKINIGGKVVVMDMNCHLCLVCLSERIPVYYLRTGWLFAKGARCGAKSQ